MSIQVNYRGKCLCCKAKLYMNGLCGTCADRLLRCSQTLSQSYRGGSVFECNGRWCVFIVDIDGKTGTRTDRLWRTCEREQDAERVARTVKGRGR